MRTVKQLKDQISEYPDDMLIFECFDAGGNFHFVDPIITAGVLNKTGKIVLVLQGNFKPEEDTNTKDIVTLFRLETLKKVDIKIPFDNLPELDKTIKDELDKLV